MEWNSKMNLVGIAEPKRIIIELFLDSLVAVPHIPAEGGMLDVGSGAGFPALVIKLLVPDIRLSLVEANAKKANFLKHMVRLLKLYDTEVINKRIESIGDNISTEGFDVISARALAHLDRIINWCARFLAANGRLLYFSGGGVDENLRKCSDVMSNNNLVLDKLAPYHLPGMKCGRTIIMLKKMPV